MVWSATEDLTVILDYYEIQINDQVEFLGAQDVVDLEAAGILDTFDSSVINIVRDQDNLITEVNTGYINQAGTSTSGIDLEVDYNIPTDNYGDFSVGLQYSYVLEYETQATPIADRYDEVGSVTTPEFRYIMNAGWQMDNMNARLTYRYITDYSDLDVIQVLAGNTSSGVHDWGIVDLSFNYDLGDYGRIGLSVRNVGDKLPDLNRTISVRNGFDSSNHDILGRVTNISYTYEF